MPACAGNTLGAEQHGKCSAPGGNPQPDVGALGDGEREQRAGNRIDGIAVDRDELALEPAEVDPHVARRRAVDDPEPEHAARFDRHDLRIVQGAVVGEIGIEDHVAEHDAGAGVPPLAG